LNLSLSHDPSESIRAKQLSAMFDVPVGQKIARQWSAELEMPDDWNVGLIVGPSGAGKTQTARQLFGADAMDRPIKWSAHSVLDDFPETMSVTEIAGICQAVGFNTIPSWMRPFHTLSNGEKFRVEIARLMAEAKQDDVVVVDEFTSVVDRQVARIASNSVQKLVRSKKQRFVGVSCHYDILEWLQPDWVFEPESCHFARRSVQQRPTVEVEVGRIPISAWKSFAPFHYMNADLHRAARCFGAWVDGRLAAFSGLLHVPVSRRSTRAKRSDVSIVMVSRSVTLPDFQGMGLSFVLNDAIGSITNAMDKRLRHYPTHPSYVRSFQRSKNWKMIQKPATFVQRTNKTGGKSTIGHHAYGGRANAVFEYCGPIYANADHAQAIWDGSA